MLPNIILYRGKHIFSFNQNTDFPISLAHTMRLGACSGLSLHWIKMHKLGQLASFCSSIMLPSSIRDIENYQSTDPLSEVVYARTLAITGLQAFSATEIPKSLITPNSISETIANISHGYEIFSFINRDGQHTVALAVTSTVNDNLYDLNYGCETFKSIEFFDSNYGCATFDSLENFRAWFKSGYWHHPDGPGNRGICRSFMLVRLM